MKKIITFAIMVMIASVSMAQYDNYNTKYVTYNGIVYTLDDDIKGNGSNNPNNYQYHVVVKEYEKLVEQITSIWLNSYERNLERHKRL